MTRISAFLLTLSLVFSADTSSAVSLNKADIPVISTNIISWYPQVIEYLYVNDTKVETVEYSITFKEKMIESRWTLDGHPVDGSNDGKRNYYMKTWDNASKGSHIVNYEGRTDRYKTEFKWYVNIYEIGGDSEGSIFDVISDLLENHAVELKIRRFRDHLSNYDERHEFTTRNIRWLHNEISIRQMKREALGLDFRNGNITFNEYVAARKNLQVETRYYMKIAKEMAKIARNEFNNEELGREFENFSFTEDDWAWNEEENQKIKGSQTSGKDNTNSKNNNSEMEKD